MTVRQGSLEGSPTVRVLVFLVPNVGTALLQLASHPRHPLAARPEGFARAIARLAPKLPSTRTGTLPLQAAHALGHRICGGKGETPLDRIGPPRPLNALTLFLARQRREDRPQLPPHLPLHLSPPSVRDTDPRVLAVPAPMRQAVISVFHTSSSV